MTTITATWEQKHPARFGAPAGIDKCYAEIQIVEINNRKYCKETRTMNGVVVLASQYPAHTEYADMRIAEIKQLANPLTSR